MADIPVSTAEPVAEPVAPAAPTDDDAASTSPKRGFRFYAIIVSLAVTGSAVSLEATIVSTALPSIISEIGGADAYVWTIMSYFLTMTAFQPLFGQLADLYGRRYPTLLAVAIYAVGSGLCGGAHNITMMIAGRTIQGLGGAGISVLSELIVCDLVPLRERGKYMAIVFGTITIGTALGPLFAGLIVQYSNWRWVFYLNLPITGVAIVLLFVFLRLNHVRPSSAPFWTILRRIDLLGNLLFLAACTSTLLALGWAGTAYPWSSFRILVPLILGFCGFVVFLLYEGSRFAVEPMMPLHLFQNRLSLVSFVLSFLQGVLLVFLLYFLPVYFQAVLLSTPARAGVQLLPTVLVMIPFAAVGGKLLEAYGQYIPIHLVSFVFMILGLGLLSLLDEHSSTAEWVIFQAIASMGGGILVPTLLPVVQAKLSEADTAKSTATWSFIRSLGLVWGSVIPSAIFNNRFDQLAGRITDSAVRAELSGGHAYEHATRAYVIALSTEGGLRTQVISVFTDSLRRIWQIGIAFAGLGLLLVFLEERVELRKHLDTQYGLADGPSKDEESQKSTASSSVEKAP